MQKEELIKLQLEKGQFEKGSGFGGIFTRLPQVMREKLNKAMPSESIGKHPSMSFLSTIKSIYVTERLNDVFGVGGWDLETEVISQEILIHMVGNPKTATDYTHVIVCGRIYFREFDLYGPVQFGGHDDKKLMGINAYKGAVTDCLSKCASLLEIGIQVFKGNPDDRNPGNKSMRLDEHSEAPKKKAPAKTPAETTPEPEAPNQDMGTDANPVGMEKPSVEDNTAAPVLEETPVAPPVKTEAELAADAELLQLQSQHQFLFGKKANANVKIENLRKKVKDEQVKRKAAETNAAQPQEPAQGVAATEAPVEPTTEAFPVEEAEEVKDLDYFKRKVDAYTSLEALMTDAKGILKECSDAGVDAANQKLFRQHCNTKCKALAPA